MVKLKTKYFYINFELLNINCKLFQELGQCFLCKHGFLKHFCNIHFNTGLKLIVLNFLII